MPRSWHIGKLFGVPLKMHWSFPLLFLYILYLAYDLKLAISGILVLSLLFFTIFGCVVLHEFGHILAARRYGIGTHDVWLTPIGGIARLEGVPKKPIQEVVVALAGPAVNLVIAILCGLLIWAVGLPFDLEGTETEVFSSAKNFPLLLAGTNVGLLIFNLIPAFPMDGGRILRAVLSSMVGRYRGTQVAVWLGRLFVLAFIYFGITENHIGLFLIAIFIFNAGYQELKFIKKERKWDAITMAELLEKTNRTFLPTDLMSQVYDTFDQYGPSDFLVVDENNLPIGALHREFIVHARANNHFGPVSQYFDKDMEAISSDMNMNEAIDLFRSKGYSMIPVIENDEIIGIITRDKLREVISQ